MLSADTEIGKERRKSWTALKHVWKHWSTIYCTAHHTDAILSSTTYHPIIFYPYTFPVTRWVFYQPSGKIMPPSGLCERKWLTPRKPSADTALKMWYPLSYDIHYPVELFSKVHKITIKQTWHALNRVCHHFGAITWAGELCQNLPSLFGGWQSQIHRVPQDRRSSQRLWRFVRMILS
jgi:hypothetical protein